MRRSGVALLAALAFGIATVGAAVAEGDAVTTQNGHEFVCTGVGIYARSDPRWPAFPLKMVFAAGNGDYLGDVSVNLTDAGGKTVIVAHCEAPWLLAKLPAGRYQAELVANGEHNKTVQVDVPSVGQTQLVVAFPEIKG
jgi:hypothetical protein